MEIPPWVYHIVQQVADMYGRKTLPLITWKTADRKSSSGTYYPDFRSIAIIAGSDVEDQELVLLHELSHWINSRQGHTVKFWNTTFDLFEKFGITNVEREFKYKMTAKFVYADRKGGET